MKFFDENEYRKRIENFSQEKLEMEFNRNFFRWEVIVEKFFKFYHLSISSIILAMFSVLMIFVMKIWQNISIWNSQLLSEVFSNHWVAVSIPTMFLMIIHLGLLIFIGHKRNIFYKKFEICSEVLETKFNKKYYYAY